MPATIIPETPQSGLFAAARMIAPGADSMLDWSSGWKLRSACPAGGTWANCAPPSTPTPEKREPCPPEVMNFTPFTIYEVAGCKSGAPDLDSELAANVWLKTNTEGWVSHGMEYGLGGFGLADLDDVSDPAGPMPLIPAISLLLRNRAAMGIFDKPTIHLPSWAAPLITGAWFNGSKSAINLAFGPGYGLAGGPATPSGAAWLYITGTVEISVRDLPNVFGVSLEQMRQNLTRFQPERAAAYRFDPCGGFKVLAKLC
jgi:hypothetical protein